MLTTNPLRNGDIVTILQLRTRFSDIISEIAKANLATRQAEGMEARALRNTIHGLTMELHIVWLAMLDLTDDAYQHNDLVELRG